MGKKATRAALEHAVEMACTIHDLTDRLAAAERDAADYRDALQKIAATALAGQPEARPDATVADAVCELVARLSGDLAGLRAVHARNGEALPQP